jgi:acetyl esterase/lipase
MKRLMITMLIFALCMTACSAMAQGAEDFVPNTRNIPAALEEIPEAYLQPAEQAGTMVRLDYTTWESFTYEEKTQQLNKTAWVYLPYGYSDANTYNVFYFMHGGWSNETTQLGTDERPSVLKHVIDHAIADGKMQPMIIVCPTYNNTSPEDSGDYGLAIQLTDQYHNELLYDLMPAVEGKYSTYAEDTTPEGLEASRDHRGFGGFSMGSVTTWRTFEHCLPYFRYFMPSSGNLTTDARYMDAIVDYYGYDWNDFFIFACSGTSDFAYYAFNMQILNMAASASGHFRMADNEAEGSLAYRVKEGYSHDGRAMMEYAYNGLCWFWNSGNESDTVYTVESAIADVINDPVFADYGRLIFPVDEGYYSGETLKDLRLTWYSNIDPNKTVEIVNYMHDRATSGDVIFYDIYTDEEKAADPEKNDTGLFFFKGEPGAKFTVCNAGGGFAYVGAMHDSFPHALELSKKGYNAFALIYRPGAQTACEDLARAISFIFAHADELEVDTECYSLWGGSAGARMAAYLGTYGPAAFGGDDLPRPGAVIMQYTGHSEYSELDPPTYACVGTNDGIASWRTMQRRLQAMESVGIPTEFHAYEGLSHGFGLGTGTVAEGWIDDAVAFWEKQSGNTKE